MDVLNGGLVFVGLSAGFANTRQKGQPVLEHPYVAFWGGVCPFRVCRTLDASVQHVSFFCHSAIHFPLQATLVPGGLLSEAGLKVSLF